MRERFYARCKMEDQVQTIVAESRAELLAKFRRLFTPQSKGGRAVQTAPHMVRTGAYWDGGDVPDRVFLQPADWPMPDRYSGAEVTVEVGRVIDWEDCP